MRGALALSVFKRWRGLYFAVFLSVIGGLTLLPLFKHFKLIYTIEQSAFSLRLQLREAESPAEDAVRIVVVGIDDFSLNPVLSATDLEHSPGCVYLDGTFPWNREVYGILAQLLLDAGARVVAFDLIFPMPNEGDLGFYECIEANPGRIVLGYDYVLAETELAQTRVVERLPYDDLLPVDISGLLGFVNIELDDDGVLSAPS